MARDAMQVVKKLIERYDYGGALEVLKEMSLESTDAAIIIDACRYAVNFDFATAKKILTHLSEKARHEEMTLILKKNVDDLTEGLPDALFSELLENVKFQIVNEEFIDFLGRVYRFKEAVYKYMFIKAHLDNRSFSFHIRFMQKKEILKILRNHYKIFNSNLVYGINAYFKKYAKHDPKAMGIIHMLNSEKMNQLIELRHESLIGHGFRGVSYEEIQRVYGNPYAVLDDFRECLYLLDVDVLRYKYAMVNDFIIELLKQIIEEDGGGADATIVIKNEIIHTD
jgi:hypothetical protein